jgi:glutathione S-transferase
MYELFIANKNYSSWSLRPWVLMKECEIPFEERIFEFGQEDFHQFSPTAKVPCLHHLGESIWDSLGITEYLAERHPRVWPADPKARAFARCAAAEMHSGFAVLRNICSMSCGVRVKLVETPKPLARDFARLAELWTQGLSRFGGPFLAGDHFTAVDAFFAPVAFRQQTYGFSLGHAADAYAGRLRALPSMQAWYASALAETWRDPPHDAECLEHGVLLEDLRAVATAVG